MSLIFASHLTGEILTWALPVGIVLAVVLYWTLIMRRRSSGARTGKVE